MSSTKNTKENRKVVRATFEPQEFVFKIPEGLDLEDKEVVENWGVKYGTLMIKYVGKKHYKYIEPCNNPFDYDYKYTISEKIDDADDEYEEEDEEEKEEEEESEEEED